MTTPMTNSIDPHVRVADLGGFDVERVRGDFPILRTRAGAHGNKPLVYLDNGATTQKPRAVIDAIVKYYEEQNANIHRGVYTLSQVATTLYETVREKVRGFIHAREAAEIIFTRGTTESINLVAGSWGRANLMRGDWVVISHLEHHSNIVPWQMVCAATGAELKIIPIDDHGELVLKALDDYLASGHVRIVSVNHVSNSLGTVNPVREIIEKAHKAQALVMVDGAQWVAHGVTDVQALDCDFYAFSGHKMVGPTGIGILYGKRALLEAMPPYQGGGDMIETVRFEKTTYAGLPNKFEAGTPDIAGVAGLGAAVDYLAALGLARSSAYEQELLGYATGRIGEVPGLRIIGTAPAARKAGVISFVMDQPPLKGPISTLDIGVALDKEGICVRTGHHCCMPVMDRFGIAATARASFAFYNTRAEVDALVQALKQISADAQRKTPAASSSDKIEYPAASARSIDLAADALAEDFALMEETGGREAKNEFVMELAARLPHLFEELKLVTERVPGCMSQVYLVARQKPGTEGAGGGAGERIFEFVADADAEIVRGLIAILQRLYSGQRARDVMGFDIERFFQRIGLEQFISSQRRNGLAGMVTKIRAAAKAMLDV